MQKTVITIQGLEVPVAVRHEDGGFLECETISKLDIPGGITIHPGALLRVPSPGLSGDTKRSYAVFHTPPAP